MKRINLIRRWDGWVAQLESDTTIWAHGKTAYEAIGDLLVHHSEVFGVEFGWPGESQ